jgi:hypothetical protein
MRKILIPLLMASAMMPATAYARPDHDRSDEPKKERASEDRPQRAERAVRVERSERSNRVERPRQIERVERQPVNRVESVQRDRQVRRDRRPDNLAEGFQAIARQQRDERNVEVRHRTDGSFTGIPHQRVERHDRDSNHRRWSNNGRRDHRYDWRNYRDRHRSLFRLGRYYDPYGWNYRRFSIGFNLGSSYYGSNYWLDDPWIYRLPPAYGPYRWVRYYDDALLVNIYTGQVVDVLYNFFW